MSALRGCNLLVLSLFWSWPYLSTYTPCREEIGINLYELSRREDRECKFVYAISHCNVLI